MHSDLFPDYPGEDDPRVTGCPPNPDTDDYPAPNPDDELPGTITNFYSAKGGQGCSVTAALYALSLSGHVLLVDAAPVYDLSTVLGVADDYDGTGRFDTRTGFVSLKRGPVDAAVWADVYDHVVIDWGHTSALHGPGRWVIVTRLCYIALKHAVAHGTRPDAVVIVAEAGRALSPADVTAALGAPVLTTITTDPGIARAVDAGLLVTRTPNTPFTLANPAFSAERYVTS